MEESEVVEILDSNSGIEKYHGEILEFLEGFKTHENEERKLFAREVVRMFLKLNVEKGDKITLKPHEGEDGKYDLRDIAWFEDAAAKFLKSLREKFAGVLKIRQVVVGDEDKNEDEYLTIEITLADKPAA
ncbi:MAG: hypothetical protein PHO48_02240 [Candidatus Gracilibacteria bacterium]|nr:hypothetical protein [Candidatus Gracilibacteria bacterium]MDD5179220.1 hypothetical protein [Candidatus Gracilibacteria bacterium]